jgi:uncharacterized protein (TIGR02001 family)
MIKISVYARLTIVRYHMIMKRLFQLGAFFAIGSIVLSSPARASSDDTDTAPPPAVDIVATVAAVSDYRFRGVSATDRDPALQGAIDVSHTATGIYGGVWASNIARYGGAKVEVDVYAGIKHSLGPVEIDVGGQGYLYPNGNGVNSYELFGYLGHTIGPAELRAGFAYAPSQGNLGNTDNLYLTSDARVGIPETPVTITASVGYEDGAFAGPTGTKWDWSVGAEATKGPFTLGLSYTDTDISRVADPTRNSKAGLVLSLSAEF